MELRKSEPLLVVYDVDGTLTEDVPGQCTGRAFWKMYERGLLKVDESKLAKLAAMQERMDQNHNPDLWLHNEYSRLIINEFDSNIGGLSKLAIVKVFEEEADYIASERIYPEMNDEIAHWRDRGASQVLISGSPNPFVQVLKKRLDLNWATGTRIYYRQGKVDHFRMPSSRACDKHLIAEKMRLRLGETAIFMSGYGDSKSDYSMLLDAAEPVAVNAKPDLREKAIEHGWRLIDTSHNTTQVA